MRGLWDSTTGFGLPAAVSDSPPFHPLSPFLPGLALFAIGAFSLIVAVDWFARDPSRRRWLVLVVVATLALLGTPPNLFVTLAALLITIAATATTNRGIAIAGSIAAGLVATLLAMPWILTTLAIRPAELPPTEGQYTAHWPLTIGVILLVWVWRRLPRTRLALGIAVVVVLLVAGAPDDDCVVREGRALDTSQTSYGCMSSRAFTLLERARTAERQWDVTSQVLDVARIQSIDGAANRDVLPDFYLAASFYVPPRGPIEAEPITRDRVLVDHVPAKMERMGAPREGVRTPADLVVEERGSGYARIAIRSAGWNVLVTPDAAWSGWRVYWNGERLPPVVVNQAFVGTFVPPGEGRVILRYRPGAIDSGLRVALIGLVLLIVTLWKPWYRRLRIPRVRTPPLIALRATALKVRPWMLFSALLAYFLVISFHFAAIAGGADSSGYLNQSRLWQRGDLIVPVRLPQELDGAFIPLGFVHGPEPYTMAPSYPPGLPLMIAGVRAVAGEAAAFRLVALLSALGVLLMYFLGRAFGLSRAWSITGAAILALFPTFVFFAVQPMTDSIAATFAVAAMLGAMRSGERWWWGALAGAAVGIGVLVRPTQFLLFPAVLLAARLRPSALVAIGLGGLPFAIVQMAISAHLYGDPLTTGYGGIGYLMSLDNFSIRFRHYSYWLAVLGTPIVFPGGLAVWLVKFEDWWTRLALAAWFIPFFLFYCFYAPYETWWYTRFLLPALPALIIGALLILRRAGKAGPPLAAVVLAVVTLQSWRFDLLSFDEHERGYTIAISGARSHMPDDAILLVMQMSGALRYYSNWPIVRWDGVDPEKFRTIRQAAGRRPVYALLAQFEIDDAMRNAPGNWKPVERFREVVLFRLEP